ncbi:MAG: nucleotidyltransferase family protein [Candidatus Hydrogenedentes bacterium]|nr:nucleotidyltransferase family protein [Candidatus Hydrogenedentota bacterium]
MITAIVLAAGESRRMGRQKLLLPYGGRTVIEHIVGQVLDSEVSQTIVVTGHDAEAVKKVLLGRPVTIVENARYREGMLTSIRRGLQEVHPEAEAFMVVLGDQPSVTRRLINELIRGFQASGRDIVVPLYDDDTGHPIIISTRYREEIMTRFDDTGLRGLIYGYPECVHRLPVNMPEVLRDMDTPEDYQRELDALAQGDV